MKQAYKVVELLDSATDLLKVSNDMYFAREKLRQIDAKISLDYNKNNRAYNNETRIGQLVIVMKLEAKFKEMTDPK